MGADFPHQPVQLIRLKKPTACLPEIDRFHEAARRAMGNCSNGSIRAPERQEGGDPVGPAASE